MALFLLYFYSFLFFFYHLVIELLARFCILLYTKGKQLFLLCPFIIYPSPIPIWTCSLSHSVYFRVPYSLQHVLLSFTLAFYFYTLQSRRTDAFININSSRYSYLILHTFRFVLSLVIRFVR